jgi:hypothetical protein
MHGCMADVDLHDEVAQWLDGLNDRDWDRDVVSVDRLADLGSQPGCRSPQPG